jgi:hypothetical protein
MKKKLDDVMSAPVLDENHVTIETLKEILDAAHHDCEVMVDGTLCMSGTDLPRPVWITINPDRKHLTFSTYDWPRRTRTARTSWRWSTRSMRRRSWSSSTWPTVTCMGSTC